MTGQQNRSICLCLFLVLILGLSAIPTSALGDSNQNRPIRIYVTAKAGPIGTVESLGMMSISGRIVQGRHLLWGSELVQAPTELGANLSLYSIGILSLSRGGVARVSTTYSETDKGTARPIMIVSLIKGDIKVDLNREAGAYIDACGYVLTATDGSSFNIGARNGPPEIEVTSGSVQIESQPVERKFIIRPIGLGSSMSVHARSSRQIQVQVTDENDKPIPDLPILFALGSSGAGSLGSGATAGTSFIATTNVKGIASVAFNAGSTTGANSITATVQGTSFSWSGEIVVTKPVGFWTPQKTALVSAGAAAGVATGLVITREKSTVRPVSTGIKP
jgi:hypothetical protein